MFENIFSHIRLRYDELLASAESSSLLARSKAQLMSRAEQIAALEEHDSAIPESYTLARRKDYNVPKTPQAAQLRTAARKEDPDSEVLGEVFFLVKSVF